VGYAAGYSNTTGWDNSYLGNEAAYSNTTGKNNSIIGAYAGYYQKGSANAILGAQAGGYNSGGGSGSFSSSTLVGFQTGNKLITGSADNIFVGFKAGYAVTTGTGNIVIGYDEDTSASGANNELNIGGVLYGDLSAKTIGISTRVPQAALDIVSTGTTVDYYAQIWRRGDGVVVASMTATGKLYADISASVPPGDNLGNHTATAALQMGNYGVNSSSDIVAARYQINGSTVLALSGGYSLSVGVDAGGVNTASDNTFVGYQAGQSNTTGAGNAFFGTAAGQDTTISEQNSFFGAYAGRSNTTGNYNSLVGNGAAYNNTTGSGNAILGNDAGVGVSGHSFSSSTIMGYMSGYSLQNGSADNIFLGWKAGYAVTTGTGNIVIGYNKDTSAVGANNELNIGGVLYGDLSAKTIGIGIAAPGAKLEVRQTDTTQAYSVRIGTSSTAYHMVVSTSGQVAIGTSNPRYSKLFIAASQGTTPTFGADDVLVVQRNANTTDWAGLSILSGSGAGSYINFGDSASFDIGGIAYWNTDDTLRFYGNGAERVRIDASGNLQFLGGTPTYKVTNMAEPTANSDAATKAYVDAAVAPKQYYVTTTVGNAPTALTACAAGYHFATLPEIFNMTLLKYNTTLGATQVDSGNGPPAGLAGWIRTGYSSNTSNTPGNGNCAVWTSVSAAQYGTILQLQVSWNTAGATIDPFIASAVGCDSSRRTWCVEDD
jgi:hypothetical protein